MICFIAVCEILYSREKMSTYCLEIPRSSKNDLSDVNPKLQFVNTNSQRHQKSSKRYIIFLASESIFHVTL